MELSGYFAVARRWWWTLLVAAWVAGLAGFYAASRIPPTYSSTVQLLVGPVNADDVTLRASGQLVQTYAQLATTGPVLDVVVRNVEPTLSSAELAADTRVIANDTSRVLAITVRADSAVKAKNLAGGIADQMVTIVAAGLNRPEGSVQIIDGPTLEPVPVAPQISLIVLLATGAGILAALVLVLLIEYFSRSIRTREELARLSGVPVLGSVPAPARGNPDPRDLVKEGSSAATVYRVIAGRIVYGDQEAVIHSLTIVDAESETGSAVVAMNLARALARLGRRVVIIDGGTRGGLATLHGVEQAPGIRDVLAREVQPRSAMRSIGDRLTLIPAGSEASDLVDPDRARAVAHELLASADVVIAAAPPVQSGPGALSWARALDRTVLVARRDHARRGDVEASAETLMQVGGDLIGTILTERPAPLAGLFGRGRSGSSRTVSAPPRASRTATPMTNATTPNPTNTRSAPGLTSTASPTANPMATPATGSTTTPLSVLPGAAAPYRPLSSSGSNVLAPSSVRPTIIRASAPAVPVTPEPPPVDPSPADTTRSTTTRSSATRSRSGRSTAPRTDPADAP